MSLKRFTSLLVFCVSMGCSFTAYSAGASGDRIPDYIEVLATGAIIIEADTNWNNPDSCTNPGRIFIPADNPFINQYYAAALTAYSTDNYLWAWLEGCQPAPWNTAVTFPKVKNMATRSAAP